MKGGLNKQNIEEKKLEMDITLAPLLQQVRQTGLLKHFKKFFYLEFVMTVLLKTDKDLVYYIK